MKTKHHILSLIILGSASAFAGPASPPTEQITPAAPSSDWRVNMTLYGWTQGLSGDVGILNRTVPVDVDFSDILSNLDIGAMGAVEVSRDRWSFIADMTYAEIGDSVTGRFGSLTNVDLQQFLGNFVASYEIVETDTMKFDAYAGTRVNWINTDIKLTGPRGRVLIDASEDEAWADPIIGVRFKAELPHSFFVTALGDVGGFDVGSQFTWQAMGGIGYHINANSSFILGYRAIGTDYTNSGFTYDITASGMMLAYAYQF